MSGELGKSSLDLEANLEPFERNMRVARGSADDMQRTLDAIAAVSKIAEDALNDVKLSGAHAAESRASAQGIISGVRGISEEAIGAARELDRVRLTELQAAASDAAGDRIDRKLKDITRNANEARRATESVRVEGGVPGRSGVGVGPFGSGFGRIGLVGAGVGAGILTGPAAVPAAAGLLASIPTLAAGGAGALGTLALAFDGVTKAIGGDKKAFDDLGPAAQRFVLTVRSLDGWFDRLRQAAGSSLFPGLTAGLKAALSPGTVNAITTAVVELGHALGAAGAAWGRYFGSAAFQQILGPLMQAGAENIGRLSDAALRLFDALGVLARAAIPLTTWLTSAVDTGARLADRFLRARDATGQLGGAMREAQTSLRLVGGLALSLLRAVSALGEALYPLSKVAIKDLTDGLNALAGIIKRNQQEIRDIVGGALEAFVATVKALTGAIKVLWPAVNQAKNALGGWKHVLELLIAFKLATVVKGWATSFKRLAGAEAIGGAEAAAGGLLGKLRALKSLGAIDLAVVVTLDVVTQYLPQAKGKNPLKNVPVLGKVFGFGGYVAQKLGLGGDTGKQSKPMTAREATEQTLAAGLDPWTGFKIGSPNDRKALAQLSGKDPLTGFPFGSKLDIGALEIAAAAARQHLAPKKTSRTRAEAPSGTSTAPKVFGKQPPFTKNVPKPKKATAPPLIPPAAAHAEALASANASRASVLGNVGETAKRYLEGELADLTVADRLIKAKYENATGRARTELFAALTSVENKMRTVRARIAKAIKDDRAAELQFAVDQAKEAVAAATVGSAAYARAVKAEEKALNAQIAYLDARVKNSKLSLAAREKAIRLETADRKELAKLLKTSKPAAGAAAANEAQFLSSFAEIVSSFAPNAFPRTAGKSGGAKTDTHLYDIKNELRTQTPLLKKAARRDAFPASAYALGAPSAVAG